MKSKRDFIKTCFFDKRCHFSFYSSHWDGQGKGQWSGCRARQDSPRNLRSWRCSQEQLRGGNRLYLRLSEIRATARSGSNPTIPAEDQHRLFSILLWWFGQGGLHAVRSPHRTVANQPSAVMMGCWEPAQGLLQEYPRHGYSCGAVLHTEGRIPRPWTGWGWGLLF